MFVTTETVSESKSLISLFFTLKISSSPSLLFTLQAKNKATKGLVVISSSLVGVPKC